jgi:hypothetical protein
MAKAKTGPVPAWLLVLVALVVVAGVTWAIVRLDDVRHRRRRPPARPSALMQAAAAQAKPTKGCEIRNGIAQPALTDQ